MVAELEMLLDGPNGTHTRIRCMCHILNLVVKVCHLLKCVEALLIRCVGDTLTVF
jgi:hypothetical protein